MYPGADINSDLMPMAGNFKVIMKRVTTKMMKEYDLEKLRILLFR